MNGQEAHDTAVGELAERYRSEGWHVWADVADWPTPTAIAGRRPDLVARDGDTELVIEVETDRSDDAAQHETFRREATGVDGMRFIGYLVDYDGEIVRRFT